MRWVPVFLVSVLGFGCGGLVATLFLVSSSSSSSPSPSSSSSSVSTTITTPPRRNLLLTIAVGPTYNSSWLAHFAGSLRRAGATCTLVVFVDTIDPQDLPIYQHLNVQIEWMADWVDRIPSITEYPLLDTRRIFLFQKYLLMTEHQYDWILVIDARDTFFQGDPFEWNLPTDVYHPHLIGNCRHNSGWILRCYAHKGLRKMKSHRVSCSGGVMGTMQGMKRYYEVMVTELRRLRQAKTSCLDFMSGADQGIHNWVLWNGFLEKALGSAQFLHFVTNSDGLVVHLHYEDSSRLQTDEKGWVLTPNRMRRVYVVHQFDRHPLLRDLVAREFSIKRHR